jgi:hypothetical protein
MPIDLRVLASVYGVIFVAELPDKTALASLVLATRYRAWAVFIGASLALTVQSIVAVAAGQLFSLLPQRPVHLVAGLLFLVSAYFMWRRSTDRNDSGEVEDGRGFWRQIRNTFVVPRCPGAEPRGHEEGCGGHLRCRRTRPRYWCSVRSGGLAIHWPSGRSCEDLVEPPGHDGLEPL